MTARAIDLFMLNVMPEPNSGCWLWTGVANQGGYGIFRSGGKASLAHRWLMVQIHGPLSREQVIDHRCRMHCCVNPDHLDIVTQAENMRRAVPFGTIGKANRGKPFCKRGHPLSGANLYLTKKDRQCRICRKLKASEYEARNPSRKNGWRARLRAAHGEEPTNAQP